MVSPDRTAHHTRRTLPFLHCLAALHGSAAPGHKVSLTSQCSCSLLGKPKLQGGSAEADKRAGTPASRCCSRGTGQPTFDPLWHLLPGLQKSHLLRETAAHLEARLCWYLACPNLHQPAPSTLPSQPPAGSSHQQQPLTLPCSQALYPAAHRVFPHSDPGSCATSRMPPEASTQQGGGLHVHCSQA